VGKIKAVKLIQTCENQITQQLMAKMGFFNKRNDVANNDIIKHVFIDDTEKYL